MFKIDGNNEVTFGGDILSINVMKYVKMTLFFMAYLFLILLTHIAWQISMNYLYVDWITTIFRMINVVLWIALTPVFIGFVIIILVKGVLDWELHKLKIRGLNKR